MASVLKECTNKEQRSVVHFFCGQNDSMQRIFKMKCFLFMVESGLQIGVADSSKTMLPT
jgi:Tat protein secretion system quality control protein TatD with DNase activity